ncbi:MAG: hypothetical protein U5R31_15310 [Acidimicrobiia bacterium]|nr:hypothetical protein [Acidimicrobiia bacterium]
MAPGDATVTVELGFMPESHAIPDDDHPGLYRAGPRASAPYSGESVEVHRCRATDWAQDETARPELFRFGFDTVDLSGFDALQDVFVRVRDAGHIADADAETIRGALDGAVFHLASGPTLTVRHVADEGLIMRRAGPNGMSLVGPSANGMNDHGVATSVHADQDVFGTPLTQLMDGRAPSLFRHDSPDGHNRDAGLMMVNLWVPLRQIVQPLVLADVRSVDRRRHQLRYGLPTGSFLDREDDDLAINDIWTFLHDPDQRWYLRSQMDHRSAYVFDTLGTPHGACTLPGEAVAEQCYRSLEAAESAVGSGDAAALAEVMSAALPVHVPVGVPPALRDAITAMVAVMDEVDRDPTAVRGGRADEWLARARDARTRVVRLSLELRLVVSIGA